jgi:hypothetical protein
MEALREGLRERETELEAISAAVDAVAEGRGGLLVVEGPAGIGKSALLREARRMAGDAGVPFLAARGSELELRFPFGLTHQLLGDHVYGAGEAEREALFEGPAHAARLVFTDAHSGEAVSPDVLHQRLNGLAWLVRRIAGDRPLVLCCDDVHWADDPSLHLLAFLARRVDRLPLLLVVGTRPAADLGRPALSALTTDASATVLRPPPLSQASVQGWIAGALGADADAAFVEACEVATGGIPFLVGELLRTVAGERLRPTAAGADRVGALGAEGVTSVLRLRLASLAPDCLGLARALSILGDRASIEPVAELAGLSEQAAGEAAAALSRAGIVDAATGLAFTHPLMRTTVYEGMDPAERSGAHGRAATMLRGRHAPQDEVAAHLLLTGPHGDAEVVDTLLTAARRAGAIGALESARAYLERALVEPPPADATAEVLTELGSVEGRLWLPGAAARLEQAMAAAHDPAHRAAAALELGRILKFGGRGAQAVDVLGPVEAQSTDLDEDLREMLALELLAWPGCRPRRAAACAHASPSSRCRSRSARRSTASSSPRSASTPGRAAGRRPSRPSAAGRPRRPARSPSIRRAPAATACSSPRSRSCGATGSSRPSSTSSACCGSRGGSATDSGSSRPRRSSGWSTAAAARCWPPTATRVPASSSARTWAPTPRS